MTRAPAPDPQSAEPLALRLVNSEWLIGSPDHGDALATLPGTQAWLEDAGLTVAAPLADVHVALTDTRARLRRVLDDPQDAAAREALNAVLRRGAIVREWGPQGAEEHVQIDPAWQPAWLAAQDLLRLLSQMPGRVRRCENHRCTMYFLDTSKNNTRRWHDMATCGNQAKASRHYRKVRGGSSSAG